MRRSFLMGIVFIAAFAFFAQAGLNKPGKSSNSDKKKSEAGINKPAESSDSEKKKHDYLPILNRWSGDYSVADLSRLMDAEDLANGGCIGNETAFVSFWNFFKRSTAVPKVDFIKNLVVFAIGERNSRQMFIAKVTLKGHIAEVVADGDNSGNFREDSLPIALAEIPRAGVQFVRVGNKLIAVE